MRGKSTHAPVSLGVEQSLLIQFLSDVFLGKLLWWKLKKREKIEGKLNRVASSLLTVCKGVKRTFMGS